MVSALDTELRGQDDLIAGRGSRDRLRHGVVQRKIQNFRDLGVGNQALDVGAPQSFKVDPVVFSIAAAAPEHGYRCVAHEKQVRICRGDFLVIPVEAGDVEAER